MLLLVLTLMSKPIDRWRFANGFDLRSSSQLFFLKEWLYHNLSGLLAHKTVIENWFICNLQFQFGARPGVFASQRRSCVSSRDDHV